MQKIIKDTLTDLLDAMDMAYESVNITETEPGHYRASIESEEYSPLLIGWHGETITAIQYLLKTLLWRQSQELPEKFFITVDVDDYRQRQEETVDTIAKRKTEEALEKQRSILLQPMSPFFRRKIHMYVAELNNPHLQSESVGEGEDRQVRILYCP